MPATFTVDSLGEFEAQFRASGANASAASDFHAREQRHGGPASTCR